MSRFAVLLSTGQETCVRNLSLLEEGRNCRKFCDTNSDCRSSSKQCLCDDVCGKSCYNPNAPCEALEPVENAVIEGERAYGNEVIYTCNDGYVLVGSSKRTCRSDKKWTGSAPYCKAVCSTPMRTSSSYPETSKDVYETGDVVTYSFRFGDECSIPDSYQNGGTCINRIDDYTCFCGHGYEGKDCSIRLDCLVPPAPTDGSVSPSSGNRVLLDGTITYSCDPGYFMKNQLHGTLKATCLRSGNWNRPTPVCEESRCIVPQTPAHGTLSRSAGEKVPADRSVSFTCDEGYTMIGQPTIYCRRSGTWSNEFPECVD
ncbi:protein lev-9-like isoform X2 [Clavelina lepadiformis]|uniref:protein lev-9-like isoform X2 n=1 Tax=Clavelina lepadiformis TaxID=159417 RepID=UPI0040432A7F